MISAWFSPFARRRAHESAFAAGGGVNAPVIEEFPVAMECELAEVAQTETLFAIVGRIVGTVAEERVLDESGKVDPARLDAIAFDQFRHGYYATGEKAGQAWNAGSALAKAALAAPDR